MSQEYDRSSKWLLEHYGAAILRLAGMTNVVSCYPIEPHLIIPEQIPDGLLEVQLAGQPQPHLVPVEFATYPERRVAEQVWRDALLVILDRRIVPEVVTLVLNPKGVYRVPGMETFTSPLGWTRLQIAWRVVELWQVPADQLLATNEVGLIPWVPLTRFNRPPEELFQECRQRIDQQASADEHANLLAVTQLLMRLRYNDPRLFAIFGGEQAMIELPFLKDILARAEAKVQAQTTQKAIVRVLISRFGPLPEEVGSALKDVTDEKVLDRLFDDALQCVDLASFLTGIPS